MRSEGQKREDPARCADSGEVQQGYSEDSWLCSHQKTFARENFDRACARPARCAMRDKPKPFDDAYLIRDGWKRVKIYPYTTADGIELYQKLRYERPNPNEPKGYEKTFLIRRPDGNGGWYGGMGGGGGVYRQQNIIAGAPGERVAFG